MANNMVKNFEELGMERVNQFKYLGIIVNVKGSLLAHIINK